MKRKKWDREGNIFIFPGTSEALIQKGRSALEAKDYDQAAFFLSEALKYPLAEEGDVKTALLLALYESAHYESALELCTDMLHKGLGDYYDVLDIYVLILMQKKQYPKIFSMLTALMEEKQLPKEKQEYFARLLELSKKMIDSPVAQKQASLFTGKESLQEQTIKLMELAHANIYPYYGELTAMLSEETAHPFLQTLVLNVLKEQGADKPVQIKKFHFEGTFIPAQLTEVFEQDYCQAVIHSLEEKLADKNPVQFEQVKEMVKRHFFLMYPFEPITIPVADWTRATLLLLHSYYGETSLKAEEEDIQASLAFMQELDGISSPIM